ncbi:hypothetical protein GCM10023078_15700 [Gibbsiella greigii]
MEEKKYQIFVSSTFTDLEAARKKVIDMILSLYHFPVGMEMFSADDGEQWQTIEQAINFSDYYIVIIGHRYGALASDGISYTEKEYDLAKENGVPILAFIRNRDIALKNNERESEADGQKKLDAFIEKAKASKMCDFWSSYEELVGKVSVALHKIFHRNPRVGWIRSSGGVSKETTEELARLSKENRKLRERISELENEQTLELPNLIVKLSEGDGFSLSLSPDYEPVIMPEEFHEDDIPSNLSDLISQDSIERYNSNIPSVNDLRIYNNISCLYHRATYNSVEISPEIKNIGRMSASNVNIEIKSPSFVIVLDKNEFDNIKEPKNIIPANPIEIAKARIRLGNLRREIKQGGGSSHSKLLTDLNSRNEKLNLTLKSLAARNEGSWQKVSNSLVEIYKDKIMHTKKYRCETIFVVPIEKGNGVIKISVICEEYKEQTTLEIPITVE